MISSRRLASILLGLFVLSMVPIASRDSQPVRVAEAAVLDTPIPVVFTGPLSDWLVTDGLAYYALSCLLAESVGPGFLKRKPTAGGTERTLSTTTAANCFAFDGLAGDSTGLYHFSGSGSGIYFRPSGTPDDPATKIVTTVDGPASESHLALRGDYVYWLTVAGELRRVRRDGVGGLQVIATGIPGPKRLIAFGAFLFWLDNSGLRALNPDNCPAFPCALPTLLAPTNGLSLHGQFNNFVGGYQIFWVELASGVYRIRSYNCGAVALCSVNPTPLYVAPAGWFVGQIRSDGTNLFWPESNSTVSPAAGRVLRMPRTGGTASEIATGTEFDTNELYVDGQHVFFRRYVDGAGRGIYKLPLTASTLVRDLKAEAMEITQGIQNLANDVPLVARKTTFVRGYGGQVSGPVAMAVPAVLHGTRNGSPLPGSPLQPLNGVRELASGAMFDRSILDDSWLFKLPSSWTTEGSIVLRLVVDPVQVYSDPVVTNNQLSRTASFVDKGPVCPVFVGVATSAGVGSTNIANFRQMIDSVRRLWPVHDVWTYRVDHTISEAQVCWKGPIPYPCSGPYELPDDNWKVIFSLGYVDVFTDDPDSCQDAAGDFHYVGLVHQNSNTTTGNGMQTGYGLYGTNQHAWVKLSTDVAGTYSPFGPSSGETLAHEMAHNFNRRHVNCGGPDDVDSSYPYPPTQIATIGPESYYGFDPKTRSVIRPDGAKDFLSYCGPRWVSDYTWRAIINSLINPAVSLPKVVQTSPRASLASEMVLFSAVVTPTSNSGEIGYAYALPTSSMSVGMTQKWQQRLSSRVAQRPGATYSARLNDAAGTVLGEFPVSPLQAADEATESLAEAIITTFSAPAGKVQSIDLLQDGIVIASRSYGPTVPNVTITQPSFGTVVDNSLTLTWQASDVDPGTVLHYVVQYSANDGASWVSLLSDFEGAPDSNVVSVSLADPVIAGSAPNQARLRVLASDGYNTGIALSERFTVSNRRPEPYIINPVASEPQPAGPAVALRGDADDLEDGGLSGSSLLWTVAGVPVGQDEEVYVPGLAPGTYEVVLAARDSLSATATATATLSVLPLSVPQAGPPLLDGFCDDAGYAPSAQVSLKPYGDGSQATVRLVRDSEQLWACFSGLKKGATVPGGFAGLRIDVNNSRDPLAQATDFGFFVAEDGGVSTTKGNGAGDFSATGPGGLAAQVAAGTNTWSAELRISRTTLGGWEHLVGLMAGHYWVFFQGDDYAWPYQSVYNKPDTWARTVLGTTPVISATTPVSATAGGPAFSLVISGSGFLTSTQLLWNGTPLTTTFGSATLMTATVTAIDIAAPGNVSLVARNPGQIESAPARFTILAPTPAISALSPSSVPASSPGFELTVTGSGFLPGALVHWEGMVLSTTFVSGNQLIVQVPESLLTLGREAQITVLNPGPESETSRPATFTVVRTLTVNPKIVVLPVVVKD